MADEVAAELRRLVLTGAFKQGERLTQDKLARSLGVSTMPVREALLRLAAEGLIAAEANRSFSVIRNSAEDLRDIYWVFGQIAGELAYRAALVVDDATVEQLAQLRARHEATDSREERFDATWQFHRLVNRTADSRRLLHVLVSTLRFFPDLLELPGTVALESDFQRRMVAALRERDADAARSSAECFARSACQIFVEHRAPE